MTSSFEIAYALFLQASDRVVGIALKTTFGGQDNWFTSAFKIVIYHALK